MSSGEKEYKEIFMAEAQENYEEINRLLTQLEKNPKDKSIIDGLFRITHTLKGNAAGMGFVDITSVAHVLEDIFGEVRGGSIQLNNEIFNALFKAVDILGSLINALENGKKIAFLGIKTKLEVLLKKSRNSGEINAPHIIEEKLDSETELTDVVEDASLAGVTLESQLQNIIAQEDTINSADSEGGDADSNNKISFSDVVQVPVRKLDNLLNLVGELIIERDRIVAAYGGNGRTNEYSRLNRISSDLQYSVMDVRLVQVGFLFNKFHRVVRDAAAVEGKNVRLELQGIDTEIDRNILQIISDSLIHLIRNSVSHGIESPGERQKKGKPQEGLILLSAKNDNDGVLIEIQDDGSGINIEKVKKKAVEKNLVSPDMLEVMNKNEMLMLIFEAGFSTKEEVSALSGRGVGMDVVKKAIDSIGGQININTVENEGTSIILKLPSSMAVKSTLLLETASQTYAIPLSYTEAVVSFYKNQVHKINNGLVATHLGRTISLIFLKDLLELHAKGGLTSRKMLHTSFDDLHQEQQMNVVIITYNNRTVGLVVDRLIQQKEIVEKPLMKPLDQVKLISGVTILGNGNVCPVLNIAVVINNIFSISIAGSNNI